MQGFGSLKRLIRDRRGMTAIFTAMVMPVVIGFAGLAVEVGRWQASLILMQTATDQAAMAASLEYKDGGTTSYAKAAKGVAGQYGFVDGTNSVAVTVNMPPATGSHKIAPNVEVLISAPESYFLISEFRTAAPTAGRRSVTGTSGGTTNTCMYSLDKNATDVTLSMTGSSTVSLSGCAYYNASPYSKSVTMTGSGTFQASSATLAGGLSQTGSGSFCTGTCTLTTNASTLGADPYASRAIPSYSGCTYSSSQAVSANKTFSPTVAGDTVVFCGSVNITGSPTVTFSNGIYIFDGSSLNITGSETVNFNNATIIFTSSSGSSFGGLTVTGSSTLNMTAPASGPTAGMVLWEDARATTKSLTITGSTTMNVTGAVYTPGSSVSWTGSGNSPCTQIIAYQITITGSTTLQHNCSGIGVSDVGSASSLAVLE